LWFSLLRKRAPRLTLDDVPTTRVLIVDDDPRFRAMAADALVARGYEVAGEAGTIAGARAAVALLRPDAVLCDVNLPDGNGLALAGELRPLRVLLTSAHADAAPRRLLTRARAGFVAKPDFLVTDLRPLLG
jgi:DNA-binding NarL/FixJ family response regulator